jgi:hypothetical protein
MGLDILIYNRKGEKKGIFEIGEGFHYWLFNEANLNKDEFPKIFKIQDYYKANAQFSGGELQDFIHELEDINKNYPFNKEIDSILNKVNQNEVAKVRITGD